MKKRTKAPWYVGSPDPPAEPKNEKHSCAVCSHCKKSGAGWAVCTFEKENDPLVTDHVMNRTYPSNCPFIRLCEPCPHCNLGTCQHPDLEVKWAVDRRLEMAILPVGKHIRSKNCPRLLLSTKGKPLTTKAAHELCSNCEHFTTYRVDPTEKHCAHPQTSDRLKHHMLCRNDSFAEFFVAPKDCPLK